MSTWHQSAAPSHPLYHDTQWTVVTDPPGRSRGVMRYDTQQQADEYIANLKNRSAENPGDIERRLDAEHSYIIPPTGTAQ